MRNFIFTLLIVAFTSIENSFALEQENYPNISGQILFESRNDSILSTKEKDLKSFNGFINIEPDFNLNFDENWSIQTGWRILPIFDRKYDYPERSRFILGNNRGVNQDSTGLIIEELKIHFENEDMKFSAGKIDPTFATMYRRSKRIGLFITDFTEDYELREKIGFSVSALLEDSEVTANTFFTDTTGLSDSGFKHRKKQSPNDGLSSNTGTLSSFSLTIEGQKFFGVENLYYNVGYRNMNVEAKDELSRKEKGYTLNLEYLYKIGKNTSIVPFFEYVRLDNFTGYKNRDAIYFTSGIIGKYSGWTASLAGVIRNIDNNYSLASKSKTNDSLFTANIGYKFSNNIAIDLSRANVKEDSKKASMIGVIISYLYKF